MLIKCKKLGRHGRSCGLAAMVGMVSALLSAQGWAREMPALPAALIGHWFNTEQHDTVGLVLNADATCVLYTSRLTVPKSERACKFEFYKDKTYFVYLKGADGVCSTEADFEFRYYQDQGRVDLQVGGGNQFLLSKKPINTAKTPRVSAIERHWGRRAKGAAII